MRRPRKAEVALRILLERGEISFKPHLSRISRTTGIPVSSLFDAWNVMLQKGAVEVTVKLRTPKMIVHEEVYAQQLVSAGARR